MILVRQRPPGKGARPKGTTVEFMAYWKTWLMAKLNRDEKGAALVEYALLLALIAVVCIVALQFLGNNASSKFSKIGNSIAG
jgi:pilus assembly protein Flp/PilA